MTHIHKITGFLILLVALCVFHSNAYAACVAGMPCVTPLTPNPDPFDGVIDPNVSGAPNEPKLDGPLSTACDADLMNQMYARAFIEAEREVVIMNTIIKKPDSVLEYTCYDQLVADIAIHAEPIFSDNFTFGTFPGNSFDPGGPSIDDLVDSMTLEALLEYANGSFSHDFLGGAATGDNNNIANNVAGVAGVCDHMFNVYHVAKCDDFGLDAPFMTFEDFYSTPDLINTDPRNLPAACPSGHGITQDLVDLAKNAGRTGGVIDPLLAPYAFVEHIDLLLPIQNPPTGGACDNADPIPTGVIAAFVENDTDLFGNPIEVLRYTYPDKFCSNPGCYFDNGGNSNPADDTCSP